MTIDTPLTSAPIGGFWRSAAAIFAGFLTVVVLSLATDQLFHVLGIYPPWGEPMWSPSLNLLALSYRTAYNILAGFLTARLTPHAPMRHVTWLGVIGLLGGTAGVLSTLDMDLGPRWYPIALAVTAFPTVWLGGRLALRAR